MTGSSKGKEPVREIQTARPKQNQKPKPHRNLPDPIDVVTGIDALSISNESPTRGSISGSFTPPRTPRIVISAPEDEYKRSTLRRQSGSGGAVKRPRLPRKSATAPPGTFRAIPTPQPPRRAISARNGRPGYKPKGDIRGQGSESPVYPQISKYGTSESRSIINRRKTSKKWIDRNGLRVKGSALKVLPGPSLKKYELITIELQGAKRTSFSEKARVKETLKSKNLGRLNTKIVDFTERDLPDTPMSLVSTPRELYRQDGHLLRPHPSPITTNLRRSALRLASGNRVKHFSLPLSPQVQDRESLRRSNSSQNFKSPGSLSRNVYLPGPIRIEDGTWESSLRATSIAITQSGNEWIHDDSGWLSDSAVLDGIAEYFEGFGITQAATEDEFDRFWEEELEPQLESESQVETEIKPSLSARSPDWKARIRLGLDEAPPSPTTPIRPSVESMPSSNGALSLSSMMTRQMAHGKEDKDLTPGRSPRTTERLRQFLRSGRSTR